jgi:DNA-binding transcriptional MerR regulator
MSDILLNAQEAAPRIGVSVGTLANWRLRGLGPPFIKTPGRTGKVLYDPADIERWKDSVRFQSTTETMS